MGEDGQITVHSVGHGCTEVSRMNRVSSDIKMYLHHIITALEFYDRMASIPTCNNCGAPKCCQYRPAWGQPVRWNCPHWKEE